MKKIALLTAHTKTNKWTGTGFCDFIDVSIPNFTEYCDKHGYTLISEEVDIDYYAGFHPTWIKILLLLKYINEYDYVVWIDADCVVTDVSIKLEDLITNNQLDLILPKLEIDRNTNTMWTTITTGFMIWRNSDWSVKTLNHLLLTAGNYSFDYFHEQSVLDNFLIDNGYYNVCDNLLYKYEEDLNDVVVTNNVSVLPYKYHRYWDDGDVPFIYHAGGDSSTKKIRMNNMLSKLNVKFGIYTSFYNCESFIESAFSQIETLNYQNFEWHITDDFSDDMTKDLVLDRLSKSSIKHKIKYYDQSEKKEMYWAPNEFFDSSFEWIVLMDADDEVDSDFLKIYEYNIKSNPDVVLISSDFHKIDYSTNKLHSISYIINDEPISSKIKRYNPKCDYLNNISYSCFGHLRAFKNLQHIKFEIIDRLAGAEDSYHVFWVNSYGKYLHIPRPLYKWNMHDNSESHSSNILPNFNGNFNLALDRLKESDFGVNTIYNDLYIETCALGSYEFGKLKGKSVSIWSKFLNETQIKKLTNLYIDSKLKFNEDISDIHIVCLNYIGVDDLLKILKTNKNSIVLLYYQNTKLHLNHTDKDEELKKKIQLYADLLRTNSFGFRWWSYIRHFNILINT
jgi:glycosyltransferase involved in cell wall biosynthesis